MTRAPTQEEIDNNPALAALQALKYEDEDPVGKSYKRLQLWRTFIFLGNFCFEALSIINLIFTEI